MDELLPPILEILTKLLTPLMQIVEKLLPPVIKIVESLMPLLELVLTILTPLLGLVVKLIDPISTVIEQVAELITVLAELLTEYLKPLIDVIEWLCDYFNNYFSNSLESITKVTQGVTDVFYGLLKFLQGDFKGGMESVMEGIKGIASGAADFFKNVWISAISGLVDTISSVLGYMDIALGTDMQASFDNVKVFLGKHGLYKEESSEEPNPDTIGTNDDENNNGSGTATTTVDIKKQADYYKYNGLSDIRIQALKKDENVNEPESKKSAFDYVPTAANTPLKTSKSETAAEKELRDLKFRHDVGEISNDEYYRLYEAYRNKYYAEGSKEWQDASVDIYNFRNKKETSATKTETAAEKELRDLKYRRNMGEITDDEYYKQLEIYRDKYYEEGGAEWQNTNVEINDYYKKQNDKNASDSNKKPAINITSYIPTVWDTEEETNRKLNAALGLEITGGSNTGKIVEGLSNISAENAVSHSSVKSEKEESISDVIRAIDKLAETDTKRKISLDLDLYARDLLIGTVAYEDINDITRRDGKSPLIG